MGMEMRSSFLRWYRLLEKRIRLFNITLKISSPFKFKSKTPSFSSHTKWYSRNTISPETVSLNEFDSNEDNKRFCDSESTQNEKECSKFSSPIALSGFINSKEGEETGTFQLHCDDSIEHSISKMFSDSSTSTNRANWKGIDSARIITSYKFDSIRMDTSNSTLSGVQFNNKSTESRWCATPRTRSVSLTNSFVLFTITPCVRSTSYPERMIRLWTFRVTTW